MAETNGCDIKADREAKRRSRVLMRDIAFDLCIRSKLICVG